MARARRLRFGLQAHLLQRQQYKIFRKRLKLGAPNPRSKLMKAGVPSALKTPPRPHERENHESPHFGYLHYVSVDFRSFSVEGEGSRSNGRRRQRMGVYGR